MQIIRQNTAAVVTWGPLLDPRGGPAPVTHIAPAAGDVELFAQRRSMPVDLSTHAIAHVAHGVYTIALTAADTAVAGSQMIVGSRPSAYLPCRAELLVLPEHRYDALHARSGGAAGPSAEAVPNAASDRVTFRECALAYYAARAPTWRSPNHRQSWRQMLEVDMVPAFGSVPVRDVDADLVLDLLRPRWAERPKRAHVLRGRIEAVLDWAAVRGLRPASNPARWRRRLDQVLINPRRIQPIVHRRSLPHDEIGAFVARLRQHDLVVARALELVILTACRKREVTGARWSEIDLASRIWTIPEGRMKSHRLHRVPLSDSAVAIINEMADTRTQGQDFVFFPTRTGQPLSKSRFPNFLIWGMQRPDITTHGFRTAFRDWAAERTSVGRRVIELALSHAVGRYETAEHAGDLLDERRALMAQWAGFCDRQ